MVKQWKTTVLLLIVAAVGAAALSAVPPGQDQRAVTSAGQAGQRRAVVIGISQYSDQIIVTEAKADAERFYKALLRADANNLAEKDARLLCDYDARLDSIRPELDKLGEQPLDVVYIYFAGLVVADQADGYLLPVNVNLERLVSTSLSVAELRSKIERVNASNIVLIVDARHHDNEKLSSASENQMGQRLTDRLKGLSQVSVVSPTMPAMRSTLTFGKPTSAIQFHARSISAVR